MRIGRRLAIAALAAAALAVAGAPPAARAADPTPTITSISPSAGTVNGGTIVTVKGTDFRDLIRVTFGGNEATEVTILNSTTLTLKTPLGAKGLVPVVIRHETVPPAPPDTTTFVLANGFQYLAPPAYLWIPRADGVVTGVGTPGIDLVVVDTVNERVAGSVDLNANDPDLVGDLQWEPTQVLFDASGAHAFVATQGTPGARDSRKVFILRTARVVGAEAGDPVLAVLDTQGNPYQVALAENGQHLYVCDGGSWKAASFPLPNGSVRRYDVTDKAAPVLSPATPASVGMLPVMAYGNPSYRQWGTNSSFLGHIQDVGSRFAVTNMGSHTISVLGTSSVAVERTVDVGVTDGGLFQLTTSTTGPYKDGQMYVQTLDVTLPSDTNPNFSSVVEYFIFKPGGTGDSALTRRGRIQFPVQFFPLAFAISGTSVSLTADIHTRNAWPHADGQSLVLLPAAPVPGEVKDPPLALDSVAAWSPATGTLASRKQIAGGGLPTTLAFNDVSKLYYARESDGGWTVLRVGGSGTLPPEQVLTVPDATGLDSLRVIGDGKTMVATGRSVLAFIQADPAAPGPHLVRTTLALPLDPFAGASFPQPGVAGEVGPARLFVPKPTESTGPKIGNHDDGEVVAAGDPPPVLELVGQSGAARRIEIEMGTQEDFIVGTGNRRVVQRVPAPGSGSPPLQPTAARWRRVLRSAARLPSRRVHVRVNEIQFGSFREYGEPVWFLAEEAEPCEALDPEAGSTVDAAAPPVFTVGAAEGSRVWIEIAGPGGFEDGRILRARLEGTVVDGEIEGSPSPSAWRRAVAKARRLDEGNETPTVFWRARTLDPLGREVFSDADAEASDLIITR